MISLRPSGVYLWRSLFACCRSEGQSIWLRKARMNVGTGRIELCGAVVQALLQVSANATVKLALLHLVVRWPCIVTLTFRYDEPQLQQQIRGKLLDHRYSDIISVAFASALKPLVGLCYEVNYALFRAGNLSRVCSMPAVGHSGGSVGFRLYVSHRTLKNPNTICCSEKRVGVTHIDLRISRHAVLRWPQ